MRRAGAVAAFGLLGHGAGLACPCSGAVAAQVVQRDSAPDRTWVRPLASVVLPGSGQLLAGQDRGAAYVAAELWVILRYLQFDRDGDRAAEERVGELLQLIVATREYQFG
jgi:hypothetical protein